MSKTGGFGNDALEDVVDKGYVRRGPDGDQMDTSDGDLNKCNTCNLPRGKHTLETEANITWPKGKILHKAVQWS